MIVTVSGGKGGVGKSTTAWNLGRELDAVVVDADLATADLPPGTGPDLHDVLAGRANPIDAVETIGSVKILPCGRTLCGARAANIDQLGQVVHRLEREWGRVIIDSPAGLARDVGTELNHADLAVLVTRPKKAALVDVFRTYQLTTALETPVGAVVLNMAHSDRHDNIATKLERTLSTDVTCIERQQALADAQAQWRPIRDYDQTAQALEAYQAVATRLEQTDKRLGNRPEKH